MTARKTGKGVDHQRIILSAAQQNPNLASAEDFEVLENGGFGSETLPYHGHCGDTETEYERLLRVGRAGNKKELSPPDEYGRTMP